MARKSRMGSDPLSDKEKKKTKNESDPLEGLNALIRDTREGRAKKKASKPKAEPKAAGAKKKASVKKKPEPKIKKESAKKPADKPKITPEVSIDLELPTKTETVTIRESEVNENVIEQMADETIAAPKPTSQAQIAEAGELNSPESSESDESSGSSLDEQDEDQYLAFRLEDEVFAFEIEQVREVLSNSKVTKIPRTPDFMVGVINLRGNVVPVVDLRLLFGLGRGEETVDTCIIIVEVLFEGETLEIGAKADAVSEVFEQNPDEIEPAPTLGAYLDTDYIKGMGKKNDEFVLILDIEKVFSAENITVEYTG